MYSNIDNFEYPKVIELDLMVILVLVYFIEAIIIYISIGIVWGFLFP